MRTTERNSTGADAAPVGAPAAPPGARVPASVDADSSMISRVAAMLGAFTPRDRVLGPSELARRTGLAKSTVSRIAAELVTYQLLERAGTGYRLGLRLFELGESASVPKDLRRVALPSMADLRNALGLTVHLAVLEHAEVVYIEILPARATPRLPSRVGGRMPAYATAVGKALLAQLPLEQLDALIERGLEPRGPNTITAGARLRRELTRTRQTGLAYEREESAVGVACAASAVLDSDGRPVAAISAAGWSDQFDERRVGPAVLTAAESIRRQIGRHSGWSFGTRPAADPFR